MTSDAPSPYVVVGAGGHAKVVIATLQAAGHTVQAVLDDNEAKIGTAVLGIPITGPTAALAEFGAAPAVLAIGDNRRRCELVEAFRDQHWGIAVHPRAVVHASVCLGAGTVVFAGAIVQPEAVLGPHTIINTGASVDHDCRLGRGVHVAPGARLAGDVWVGDGALLGLGSVVLPGVSIGAWATVGAGAVVTASVPDHRVAVGVPARLRAPVP